MKKVLLDTSVIIDFLRRKDKDNSLLISLTEQKYELAISIMTHTELFSGKSVWEKKELCEAVEKICSGLEIISLDEKISIKAGEIKAKHHNVGLLDCIIAATAILHDLTVVTFNKKDFEQISKLKLF